VLCPLFSINTIKWLFWQASPTERDNKMLRIQSPAPNITLSVTQLSLLTEYFDDYIKPKMSKFIECQTTEADTTRALGLLKSAAEEEVTSYCTQISTLFRPQKTHTQELKPLLTLLISLNSLAHGNATKHSFIKTVYDERFSTSPANMDSQSWKELQITLIGQFYKDKITAWVSTYLEVTVQALPAAEAKSEDLPFAPPTSSSSPKPYIG
jgi:hypothetical protein